MSGNAGNISTTLTLDASRFSTALDKATGDLTSFDKTLKTATKEVSSFEKNFDSIGKNIGVTADKFKLLDQAISGLVSKLNSTAAGGFEAISTKSKKASKDIEGLSVASVKAGDSLKDMTTWIKQYGGSLESLNPLVAGVVKSQSELSASNTATANSTKQAAEVSVKAKLKALETEKLANAETIRSRQAMVAELAELDRRMTMAKNLAQKDASRYFGRNKAGGDTSRQEAAHYEAQAGEARATSAHIQAVVKELQWKNAEIAKSIDLTTREAAAADTLAKTRRDQVQQVMRDEKAHGDAKLRTDKEANATWKQFNADQSQLRADERRMWQQYEGEKVTAARRVAKEAAARLADAESQFKKMNKEVSVADKAAAQKKIAEAKVISDAATAEARKVAEAQKAIDTAKRVADKQENAQRSAEHRAAIVENNRFDREAARATANARKLADKEVADERKRLAKETHDYERAQAQQLAQMFKGMAALWGASKVQKGIASSVEQADQFERQGVAVSTLGYTSEHNKSIMDSAFNMSKTLGFISTLDAIKSRMSAIASIGHDDAEVIDKTLGNAVKAANNLQTLGYSHGDMQSSIRNLYGVVEMRQLVGSVERTNATFEVMQKIITGTAGKVQTQDMETVLRRMGMGAAQLSDNGLINLAAVVDQFKVAGGEGGGGGASGVSTVGTAFKMMQAYSLGKGLSNTAVKEFAGAGVLSTDGLDLSKDNAGILRDAKHGGFKDAQLWLQDPVAAVQKIFPKILEYTQRKDQQGKFYQGRDTANFDNQMTAVAMYLARLGITTTAAQALMVAGDPRSQKRIEHQAETIKNSKGIDGVDEDLKKTYARNVQEVKVLADDLATLLGTSLLPALKTVLGAFRDILVVAREFARENPIAVTLTAVAGVIGGVVATAAGMLMMFGTTIPAALTLTAGASLTLGFAFKALMSGVLRLFSIFAVGLAAFNITSLLLKIKVGGISINDHISNMINEMTHNWTEAMLKLQEAWLDLKGFFGVNVLDARLIISGKREANEQGRKDEKIKAAPLPLTADGQRELSKGQSFGRKFLTKKENADFVSGRAALNKADEDNNDPAKNAKVIEAAGAGKTRKPRNFEDQFFRSFAQMESQREIGGLKLGTLRSGDTSYKAQAEEEFKAHWLGGDFDEGHDPSKRKFLKKGASKFNPLKARGVDDLDMDATVDVGGRKISPRDWMKERELAKEQADQFKALTFATERSVSATEDADAASTRLSAGGLAKQTDAMRALNREFAREEVRNPEAAKGSKDSNSEYSIKKAKAFLDRASADVSDYASDMLIQTRELNAKMATDAAGNLIPEKARLQKEFEMVLDNERLKYEVRKDALDKEIALLAIGSDARIKAEANQKAAAEAFAAWQNVMRAQEIEKQKSPVMKLAQEWGQVYKNLEAAQVNWANGFATNLETLLDTGKADFKGWALSIAKDIRGIMLRDAIATPLAGALKGFGDSVFKGIGGDVATGARGGASDGMSKLFLDTKIGLAGFWNSIVGASDVTKSLTIDMSKEIAQQALGIAAGATKMTAEQAATASLMALTQAAYAASFAMGASGTSAAVDAAGGLAGLGGSFAGFFGGFGDTAGLAAGVPMFANGGIMSSLGSLPLNLYAGGGIANSPQMAVFGEGRMNEAYVPLPDGRSIPVSMTGGGGTNVTIQINVASDGSSQNKASGKDDGGMWQKMAGHIQEVVREELVSNRRPGGLLYK